MNNLTALQARIKGSRLYKGERNKTERLYFNFRPNRRDVKINTWFEVVNDRIRPFAKVENYRSNDLYDTNEASYIKQDIEKAFHEIINDCELERKKVPLHERLRDDVIPVYDDRSEKHQIDALRFLCSMKVSALFADTGTMKTKIVIDLAISRYEAGQIKKVLVFLPVSTIQNFQDEIDLWCNISELEWKLIGEESMGSSNKTVFEALKYVDNQTQIIIDESHMVKTPTAKRSKRIKKCCNLTSYKVVMTGTPVTENIHNLYMQYSMLSDLIIGVNDWLKFEEKYLIIGGRFGDEIIGYKNLDHLMGLLEPYTYQIDSNECLHLPAKQFFTYTCDLNEEQWEKYQAEKDYLLKIIQDDNLRATDIFQVFTKMQQISSGYYNSRDGEIEWLGTHKLSLMRNIPLNEKIAFFCKYLFEVDMLIEHLGVENCAIFTGKNRKTRDSEKYDFVYGGKQYFVSTMQSGGTGLNGLQTVSNRIVFFSNSFSYTTRKQAIGRIDRKGQKNEMYIHDFRTVANIDDKIMKNLSRKGNLADEIKQLMKDKTKLKQYIEEL